MGFWVVVAVGLVGAGRVVKNEVVWVVKTFVTCGEEAVPDKVYKNKRMLC